MLFLFVIMNSSLNQDLDELIRKYNSIPSIDPQQHYAILMNAASVITEELTYFMDNLAGNRQHLSVVPKTVITGKRGGAYYINERGNKIWLKKDQKTQCVNGTLLGSGNTCPKIIRSYSSKK